MSTLELPRAAARHVRLGTVAELCAFVDDLERDAAGELVVEAGEVRGSIYIEHARICWAAAAGLSRRLTELLVERAGLDAGSMAHLYRACRDARVPLGEYLVERGVVSADDLRAALAQHTVESLRRLTGPQRSGQFRRRQHAGYNARFTFGTAELLAKSGASTRNEAARLAEAEMVACFSPEGWAAAFVRSVGRSAPEPIALHGEAPAEAQALARLARWATSALDLVAAFSTGEPLVAVRVPPERARAGRESALAFRLGELVIAGEAGAHCAARILNRRARHRASRG